MGLAACYIKMSVRNVLNHGIPQSHCNSVWDHSSVNAKQIQGNSKIIYQKVGCNVMLMRSVKMSRPVEIHLKTYIKSVIFLQNNIYLY